MRGTKFGGLLVIILGSLLTGRGSARFPMPGDNDQGQTAEKKAGKPDQGSAPRGRTDRFGDPLPEGALARLGTVRFNHGDGLKTLLFSPDAKTILSEGKGSLRLWDAATGAEVDQLTTAPTIWGDQVVWLPDGKTVVFLNQENPTDVVRVYDLVKRQETRALPLPVIRGMWSVDRRNALSPDGQLAAANTPKVLHVFDLTTGKELTKLPKDGKDIRDVVFSGNDRLVSADAQQTIEVWDARTGKLIRRFAHGAPVEVLAASANGRMLATLEHHTRAIDRYLDKDVVHLWDLTTGTATHVLPARPKSWYMKAHFTPDGKRLLTTSSDETGMTLTLWEVETGKQVGQLDDAVGMTVAISPDGSRMAEGAQPGKFELWDLKKLTRLAGDDSRHSRAATVFFAPTGDRVVTIGYSSLSTWNAATGRRLDSFDLPPFNSVNPLRSHSPDGRLALSFTSGEILVWDVTARRKLHTLRIPGESYSITTAFSSDSSLLVTLHPGKENVVRFWDMNTGREIRSFTNAKETWPGNLSFSADGKTLIIAGKHTVAIDVASSKERYSWRMKPLPNTSNKGIAVGGRIMTDDDRIAWRSLAFAPDGTTAACILAGGGFGHERVENRMALCDARTGKILRRWSDSGAPGTSFEQLQFSRDGSLLASTDGQVIHLWEVVTGKEIRNFQGHRGEIDSLAFDAGDRRLASASWDSTVLIWDLTGPTDEPLTAASLERSWKDLAGNDAGRAHFAAWALARDPGRSLPFLKDRLRPVEPISQQRLKELIVDLDSDQFTAREKASTELTRLGDLAASALRQTLEGRPSLEQRRRIEQLLEKLDAATPSGDALRLLRAVRVLEHAGVVEAQQLLRELAGGAGEAHATRAAKAALARLSSSRRGER